MYTSQEDPIFFAHDLKFPLHFENAANRAVEQDDRNEVGRFGYGWVWILRF